MSYFRIPSGSPLVLNVVLQDGAASKYPQAFVYNQFNTQIAGSPFPLPYVGSGLYSNIGVNVPDGRYIAVIVVYEDALHTTPSPYYGRTCDTFDVNDIIDVQAIAEAVWRIERSGNQPTGSFGEFIDASILSRESDSDANSRFLFLGGAVSAIGAQTTGIPSIQSDTTTLLSRLTALRALKLDNLDVAVSSRAAVVDPGAIWDVACAGHSSSGTFGERIDAVLSTRATQSSVDSLPTPSEIAMQVWDEPTASHMAVGTFGRNLDSRVSLVETESNAAVREGIIVAAIDSLDTKIGVPAASVSADIAAVKAQEVSIESKLDSVKIKTDQLGFTAGNVNANAQVVTDKTGFALSGASEDSVVNKVWDEAQVDHVAAGSVGKSLSDAAAGANVSAIADAVWDEARAGHVAVGSFGEVLDAKVTSRATQADLAGIAADVSSIELKADQIINQTTVAGISDAVWNEDRVTHTSAGTFGEANQGVVSAGRATGLDNLSRLDVVVSTRAQQVTADSILAQTTSLESRLTGGRAVKLDNLDVAVSTRATPITVPSATAIADAVWEEPLAAHATMGSTGEKLILQQNGPTSGAIADAVWDEAGAGHVGAGSFGLRLDAAITSRASQTSLDDAKGAGFNSATDSLQKNREKLDTLPTSAGDATVLNQNAILGMLVNKASQASVTSLGVQLAAIPTTPLLQTDLRLNNLDATISSRATEANVNTIKGAGFNATTDTLEKIRDAVDLGLDTSSILADLGQIKGVGFNSAQHSLKLIADKSDAAKLSADNASANAANAYAEAATKASQASVNVLAADVSLIPTSPLLAADPRLSCLDETISSRLSSVEFEQILGSTFNPATDNLTEIRDAFDAIQCGDATLTNQEEILNIISDLSSQASVNSLAASVAAIPINPALQTDPRLANLDATVSSRASQVFVQSMAGTGFNPVTDSLEQIKDAIPSGVDTATIMDELARIRGSGFVDNVDDLHHINEIAKTERGQIQTDIDALLSNGSGV